MLCQECGTANPDSNNFCGHCGRRLFAKVVREVPIRETVAANQGRVRSTGDALSRLGIADYDYVDVSEQPPVETMREPAPERVAADPVPIRPSPLSVVPPPEAASHVTEPPVRIVEPEPVDEPVRSSISGPSFLGLADVGPSDESEYLLQDDSPRSHGGLFLLIVVLIIIGIVGWLEWPKIKSGQIHIPYLDKLIAVSNSGTGPAANDKAVNQADNSDEKLTTNDPTLKDQSLDTKPAENKPAETNPTQASSAGTTPPADGTARSAAPAAATPSAATPEAKQAEDAKRSSPANTSDNSANDAEPPPVAKPAPSGKAKPSAQSVKAEGGPDQSQNANLLMGEKYLYGRGAPQNCNQALSYFKAAAGEDNAPAMSHLAAMYASGNCVTMNRVTAYTWFAKAQNAEPGNRWRERNMNMLWRDMTPQERAAVSR